MRYQPPRPYLTVDEIDERLDILGFVRAPEAWTTDTQVAKLEALEELISAAIAEWVGLEVDKDGSDSVTELQEWAEEYLVG